MRRLLLVAAMSVALIVLILLHNQVATWHFQITGPPGALLYLSTYNNGLNVDWQQYDDGRLSAQVVDGGLQITNAQVDRFAYSIAAPHFGDFDLRVEAKAVDGPLDNGFGVVYRYVDGDNFYMFLVSSDGYYQVNRVLDGTQTALSTWIASEFVRSGVGAANYLRVVARGSRFEFYVNGQPLQLCVPDDPSGVSTYRAGMCIQGTMRDTLEDASLSSGQVGVIVLTFAQPDVAAQFDNFVLYAPEGVS